MANRLADESSPYLLQHKDNPVDWYPWSEEALARARAEERPILLSIGYSACHWCHVMERESFEDEETARLMNRLFVNIKVDREERPDLDSIYMNAVTAMTGHGGWPMTVFLTPEGAPFYGGTYYPPEPRYGMPSFRQVLESVASAFQNQRESLESQGQRLVEHIASRGQVGARDGALSQTILQRAMEQVARQFDARWGGFSLQGPKFPQPMILEFVLRQHLRSADPRARRILDTTLTRMARGGMYDQLGGGFARYSVDEKWLVPHFEKMLYDNGQLISLYLHAYQLTGRPLYRQVVEESLAYLEREMLDPVGAFFSSQDADSEGVEGKFFIWSAQEIDAALTPEQARVVRAYYDVTPGGNFEGKNILWVPVEPAQVAANLNLSERRMNEILAAARATLLETRAERIPPGTDTKVLTAWNALAIAAFATAARVLRHPPYAAVAVRAARFLLDRMRDEGGRLRRTWRAGSQARLAAYLEDYSYLIHALTLLYEATFEPLWLDEAAQLAERMIEDFTDPAGGFFDTGVDHERLIVRPKEIIDNATPSGNSMAALALLRLAAYRGEERYREIAAGTLRLVGEAAGEQPLAFGHWLVALDWYLGPVSEFALVGSATEIAPFLEPIYERLLPNKIVAHAADDARAAALAEQIPLLAGRSRRDGAAAAYLCRNFTCRRPVTDPAALRAQIDASLSGGEL